MKKTSIMTIAATLSMAVALSGCGGGGGAGAGAAGTSGAAAPAAKTGGDAKPAAGAVTLKFWGGVPPEGGPQTVVDNWNKAHPDIKVEYVRYVNDDPGNLKLETALLSSTDAPDIYVTYGDDKMSKRVDAGMATPLDDLIAKDGFDVDGIIGSSNIKKFDGKYYYLPANRNLGTVLINKKALDAAGEKIPTSWTWDDFSALAKKLNKGDQKGTMLDPTIYTFGEMMLSSAKPQDYFLAADGTSYFNSPAMKQSLELQKGLEDAGVMKKYSDVVAGKLSFQNELLTGKAAMVPAALFLIRYIKDTKNFPHDFPVAFAPMPQIQAGGNVNPNGGMGDYLSINKNSPNKDAAMKFIDWYLKDGDMDMVPGGRIPTNKKADNAKIASILVGNDSNLIDTASLTALLSGTYTYPTLYNVPVATQLKTIYKEELEKYLLNAEPLDKAMANMKSRADDAIQKAKK
jgi:multiple sugar transport system substrate-binding protein